MSCTLMVDWTRGPGATAVFDADWDSLAAATPSATVFQTAGWYRAWLRYAAAGERAEPAVLTVREAGRLVAAVALQVCDRDGERVVEALGTPWADYHEALAGAGLPSADLLTVEVERFVAGEKAALRVRDVVPRGALARLCTALDAASQADSATFTVRLDDGAPLRESERGEYARKRARLDRRGRVRCVHHSEPGAALRALEDLIALHREQWERRGQVVGGFDGGGVDATFRALIEELAPDRGVLLTELRLDEDVLAAYFGFLYKRRYWAYRTAFAASWRRFSPGHLMLGEMFRDLAAMGVVEFDLMRGDYAYKHRYASRRSSTLRFAR